MKILKQKLEFEECLILDINPICDYKQILDFFINKKEKIRGNYVKSVE